MLPGEALAESPCSERLTTKHRDTDRSGLGRVPVSAFGHAHLAWSIAALIDGGIFGSRDFGLNSIADPLSVLHNDALHSVIEMVPNGIGRDAASQHAAMATVAC